MPAVAAEPVDSGVYHYRLNGQDTAIEERWQRYRHPSGAWQVSSMRRAPGLELRVEAELGADPETLLAATLGALAAAARGPSDAEATAVQRAWEGERALNDQRLHYAAVFFGEALAALGVEAAVVPEVGRTRELAFQLIERRYGVHVVEVGVEVMARPMPVEAAKALGVEPGSPSMTVVRRYRDERGELLCVSVSEHPGDRYTFAQTLKRAWDTGEAGWTPE